MTTFIKRIKLNRFLSYGPSEDSVELGPLNVLIGPNGSGKSNLIEAIELLHATPRDLLTPIRDGGGVRDWLWKGESPLRSATIDAVITNSSGLVDLRYVLEFAETAQRFEILDERIENAQPYQGHTEPYFYYRYQNGHSVLNVHGEDKPRYLQREDIDPTASILSQRKDPDQYPELTYLGDRLGKIRLYREWSFGRFTKPRLSQKADLPNSTLEPDASNLGLVLNRLRRDPSIKKRLLEALQVLYEGIDDFEVQVDAGTVQVFLQEGHCMIPATRLSDGTLRYLSLLAVLVNPTPPPLICIEEPELGLHPDVLPILASLLREATDRTQLVVTTHSDVLVDAMTDVPESVLVTEKTNSSTTLSRLDKAALKPWLEKYRLGQLWTRGDIGGTRW